MTDHYVQLDLDGSRIGTWEFTDTECYRLDSDPRRGGIYHYEADSQDALWALLGEKNDWFREGPKASFHRLDLLAGRFHPHMARPEQAGQGTDNIWYPGEAEERSTIAKARGQLAVLTRSLDEICQTIHPEGPNLDVFGHDIRNLLILACTEAEAHWRGVLVANGQVLERPNTVDYVKLAEPLRLREYAVSIAAFPWLEPIAPFRIWGATGAPTQELAWYHAYNDTKHDRDRQFARATLRNAIEAVCANVIMTVAQYGLERALGDGSLLIANYTMVETPNWSPADLYSPPYDEAGRMAEPYTF
jgi:hypothetical protein